MRGVREVEAESVAYLVTAAHGLDSDAYTFPYVASWASGPAATDGVPIGDIVTRTGTRVMRAAGQLIDTTTAAGGPGPERRRRWSVRADDHRRATQPAAGTDLPGGRDHRTVDQRRTLLGVVADSQQFFRQHSAHRGCRATSPAAAWHRRSERVAFGYAPPGWTGSGRPSGPARLFRRPDRGRRDGQPGPDRQAGRPVPGPADPAHP